MKTAIFFLSLLTSIGGFSFFSPGSEADAAIAADWPVDEDICQLKGTVYIEELPMYADYSVYIEEVESFADLVVFKENVKGFASEPGLWHFTDNRAIADFSIHIERVSGFADFSIHYSDFRSAAGCH